MPYTEAATIEGMYEDLDEREEFDLDELAQNGKPELEIDYTQMAREELMKKLDGKLGEITGRLEQTIIIAPSGEVKALLNEKGEMAKYTDSEGKEVSLLDDPETAKTMESLLEELDNSKFKTIVDQENQGKGYITTIASKEMLADGSWKITLAVEEYGGTEKSDDYDYEMESGGSSSEGMLEQAESLPKQPKPELSWLDSLFEAPVVATASVESPPSSPSDLWWNDQPLATLFPEQTMEIVAASGDIVEQSWSTTVEQVQAASSEQPVMIPGPEYRDVWEVSKTAEGKTVATFRELPPVSSLEPFPTTYEWEAAEPFTMSQSATPEFQPAAPSLPIIDLTPSVRIELSVAAPVATERPPLSHSEKVTPVTSPELQVTEVHTSTIIETPSQPGQLITPDRSTLDSSQPQRPTIPHSPHVAHEYQPGVELSETQVINPSSPDMPSNPTEPMPTTPLPQLDGQPTLYKPEQPTPIVINQGEPAQEFVSSSNTESFVPFDTVAVPVSGDVAVGTWHEMPQAASEVPVTADRGTVETIELQVPVEEASERQAKPVKQTIFSPGITVDIQVGQERPVEAHAGFEEPTVKQQQEKRGTAQSEITPSVQVTAGTVERSVAPVEIVTVEPGSVDAVSTPKIETHQEVQAVIPERESSQILVPEIQPSIAVVENQKVEQPKPVSTTIEAKPAVLKMTHAESKSTAITRQRPEVPKRFMKSSATESTSLPARSRQTVIGDRSIRPSVAERATRRRITIENNQTSRSRQAQAGVTDDQNQVRTTKTVPRRERMMRYAA